MGLTPIFIQQGEFSIRPTNNAGRETKSPKQVKTNRSVIQANQKVSRTQVSTPVSVNIAQVSLKKAQVSSQQW